ncbi:MAG: stage II sporulation protein M, partial [archaeon]|nr:stage II sporulation protein M [archaeon]
FVGLFYAAASLLLVNWVFSADPVLSKYSGILVVTFTVMFSMPFVYYTIKLEENKVDKNTGSISLLKEHKKAIYVFLWLFFGYVVAFSLLYVLMPSTDGFKAQIETFCMINQKADFDRCVTQYTEPIISSTGSSVTHVDRFLMIFSNNMSVLIFTLVFSLIFGAGAIFILAWNASVIAAAIGIFMKSDLSTFPMAVSRYMIHGLPEIAAYFIVALAGGIVSIAVIKHEVGTRKFWEVLQDSLNLVVLAVIVLVLAALLEVYVTSAIF